eukprot:gnl/TRDRNA2_/TRDRNA2_93640_c0_seq2.p1 gnl/TRDRNA2_/TRDRNA2_93640_c0~~gnl/TRDRNA2_/TRDRNA2_93640_c0_seq2.p1  ORF type:complete len:472 (-),score=57.09 gnl/TRDRNA2_/TRDRNA2_93640_c0_seq2:93-1508(-)
MAAFVGGLLVLLSAGHRLVEAQSAPAEVEPPIDSSSMPSSAFPGETAKETHEAWPRGRQPKSLEAWPRDEGGKLLPCWKVKVLSDKAGGWPGSCTGLSKSSASSLEACREECVREVNCPVWQFTKDSECWHDEGRDCTSTSNNVEGAERLQHGSFTVIMDITDLQIMSLYKLGSWSAKDEIVGIEHCKKFCYSNLRCQYWQYTNDECYVEVPEWGSSVPYPLTTQDAKRIPGFADAGEYIQHFCPPKQSQRIAFPDSQKNVDLTWVWILVGVVAIIFILMGLCILLRRSPSTDKKRALKHFSEVPERNFDRHSEPPMYPMNDPAMQMQPQPMMEPQPQPQPQSVASLLQPVQMQPAQLPRAVSSFSGPPVQMFPRTVSTAGSAGPLTRIISRTGWGGDVFPRSVSTVGGTAGTTFATGGGSMSFRAPPGGSYAVPAGTTYAAPLTTGYMSPMAGAPTYQHMAPIYEGNRVT